MLKKLQKNLGNKYKFIIPQSILLILLFAIILNLLRIFIFDKFSFIYLLWNIFLAIIPFIISLALLWFANKNRLNKILFFIFGIVWLLFIPNAPYIITDLIHIGEVRSAPVLFDSFLLFSSAWVGLLLGMFSIDHMRIIFERNYSKRTTYITLYLVMFLISFGMYLGRFLRFNSWDIFEKPHSFIVGIVDIFSNKENYIEAFFYTGLFFFFLIISYNSWRITQTK